MRRGPFSILQREKRGRAAALPRRTDGWWSIRLEVEPQGELQDSRLVRGGDDRSELRLVAEIPHRQALVRVVEQVEGFDTEREVPRAPEVEPLVDAHVDVPEARPSQDPD